MGAFCLAQEPGGRAARRPSHDGSAQALRGAVLPFVFRRYLDYNVFDALRVLHRQIREHAAKRSAGHPERANDVKLSRGGIREIEFTVQLLQVVRGGQFPELRTRPTLDALQRAGARRADAAGHRRGAGRGLRVPAPGRAPHPVPGRPADPCVCPTRDDDLAWIAATWAMPSCCPFLSELDAHRELVAQEFDTLLAGAGERNARAATEMASSLPMPTSTRCWNSCPSLARARRGSGANTRACWPCATTRARA